MITGYLTPPLRQRHISRSVLQYRLAVPVDNQSSFDQIALFVVLKPAFLTEWTDESGLRFSQDLEKRGGRIFKQALGLRTKVDRHRVHLRLHTHRGDVGADIHIKTVLVVGGKAEY